MLKHLKERKTYLSAVNENSGGNVVYTKEDFDLANKRMSTCSAIVQTNNPFFAVLIKKLLFVPNTYIPTMATDGNAILFNPKFTNSITEGECIFVIQHELLHCALKHFVRMDGRNPELWNYATDYAINYMLQEMYNESNSEGASRLEGTLYDPKYADMKSEDIYDQLEKEGGAKSKSDMFKQSPGEQDCSECGGSGEEDGDGQDGDESGDGQDGDESGDGQDGDTCKSCGGTGKEPGGSGPGGEGSATGVKPGDGWNVGGIETPEKLSKYYKDPDNPNGVTKKDLDKAWEVAVKKAMKQAGNMPGNVKRMINDLIEPVINWRKKLKKYINAFARKNKYKLPNRRHIQSGKYIPGMKRSLDGITNIVIGIDTSGSINDEMLQVYLSEVYDILKTFDPEKTIIHYIDTEIRSTDIVLKKGKPDRGAAKGGGGTAFEPLFTWINKNIKPKDVSIVLYFTDLYGDTSFKKPKYYDRVIWVLEKDSRHLDIPWGKKLVLDKNYKNK